MTMRPVTLALMAVWIGLAAGAWPTAARAVDTKPYEATLLDGREIPWWRRELNEFRVYPHRERFYRRMQEGQTAAALEELRHILKVDPDNDWARFQALGIHYQNGRLDDAVAWADRLIARQPRFAPAYYYRGLAHYEGGRRLEAARDLSRARSLGGLTPAHRKRADHLVQSIALEETFITVSATPRSPVALPSPTAEAAPKPRDPSPAPRIPERSGARPPPPAPPAHYRHMTEALAQLKAGDTKQALADLATASKAGAGPVADLYRGYALKALGRPVDAAAAFKDALAAESALAPAERAAAWREVGYLAAAAEDYEKAIAAWQRALSIETDPALTVRLTRLLRLTGQWGRAKKRLMAMHADALDPSLEGLYFAERAALAWHEDSPKAAIEWQERAAAAEPTAAHWARLGQMRAAQGQHAAAISALEKALALAPDDPDLQAELGYAQYAAGELTAARQSLARAAAGLAAPGAVYEDLGYLNLRLGSPAKAGPWFRKAIDETQRASTADARRHELRLKQEVEWIEDRLDLTAYTIYRAEGTDPFAPNPLGRTLLHSGGGVEAGIIPPGLGHESGRYLRAFSRLLWSYEGDSPDIAGRSLQGGVGLRAKPFAGHDAVFSVERLIAAGEAARDDWMLRTSYSWSRGLDPWFSAPGADALAARTFLDIALVAPTDPDLIAAAEGLLGWGMRRGRGWLIWPHVVVAGTIQDDDFGSVSLLEAGPGLGFRMAFGETGHRAYLGAVEVFLQYRAKVAGDSRGSSGAVLILNVRY